MKGKDEGLGVGGSVAELEKATWPYINHPLYEKARDLAFAACATARPGDIVLIVGATGAGKSYMLDDLEKSLVAPSAALPMGRQPLVRIQLDVDGRGVAMIKEAIIDLNRKLGNPFLARNCDENPTGSGFRIRISTPEGGLRNSFRFLAKQRGTRFVLLDEIQHINPRRRAAAMARFESIKMIAGCSSENPSPGDVVLVLAGHYSILDVLAENAQVGRRTTVVCIRTYDETIEADVRAWHAILAALDCVYPLGDRSLCDWNDVLFRMSIGDLGILRSLLDAANVVRMACGEKFLKTRHLLEAKPIDSIQRSLSKEVLGARLAMKSSEWGPQIRALESRNRGGRQRANGKAARLGIRKLGARDPVGE